MKVFLNIYVISVHPDLVTQAQHSGTNLKICIKTTVPVIHKWILT